MPRESPQEQFLIEFHRRHPGVTASALARGRDRRRGASSYQLLADAVAGARRVLDLGCGDATWLGLLGSDVVGIGADLSAAELAAARVPGARLIQARAQALPLADASIDACGPHLAFTLMPDLDDVVAELARVIRPGGRFAAVVGGGPRLGDAFERFLDLLTPIAAGFPRIPALGDRRARRDDGLAALLGGEFVDLAIVELDLALDGSVDEVWATLATSYELAPLDDPARVALHAGFVAAVAPLAKRGVVPCTMAARLVTAIRR